MTAALALAAIIGCAAWLLIVVLALLENERLRRRFRK